MASTRALIIPAKHHELLKASSVQKTDSIRRAGTHRVADSNDTEDFAGAISMGFVPHDHNRWATFFDVSERFFNAFRADCQLVRKAVVADEKLVPVYLGFRTAAGPSLIVCASEKVYTMFLSVLHDGLR